MIFLNITDSAEAENNDIEKPRLLKNFIKNATGLLLYQFFFATLQTFVKISFEIVIVAPLYLT